MDKDEINEYLEIISNGVNEKTSGDQQSDKNVMIDKCIEIFKGQLQQTKDINELFHSACMMGNIELVEYLLSNESIDVNYAYILTHIYEIPIIKVTMFLK